ncbi:MAG TPA: NAD(P)/FAD-dependent oxidoreductase [Gemmatimonadaceae bacterium]|nr:NAD(P)/FAD-dependent oxidoreductase [Gemmatimonadaceae bacterium]
MTRPTPHAARPSPQSPVPQSPVPLPPTLDVAIIGAGFSGLGMAIGLDRAGWRDWVILERGDEVGGTWRDNRYPGCACDVQSHLYSFSFALEPDWSRSYSPQPEILAYLQRVAREHGLRDRVRFRADVRQARWDPDRKHWSIQTAAGVVHARMLVMASGALSDPVIPSLPGLERFAGTTFHSARWNHDVPLAGKRVAVIGTGASAIQFVPIIQRQVARLHLFQRTPAWIMPQPNHRVPRAARWLYRHVPGTQRAVRGLVYAGREAMVLGFRHPRLMRRVQRVAERHLARQVPDAALRRKLTPGYTLGCKRILLSNDFYPAIQQPNVELVTTGIASIGARAIVDGDGVGHGVDVIIFGTGFQPTHPPLADHLRGREGETLAGRWARGLRAFAGTTVHGFPNFFVIPGPNTGLGHSSVVYMSEAQIAHVVAVMRLAQERGAAVVEPSADAEARWMSEVDRRMRGTVWVEGGCRSWYLDETGRNSTIWPDFTWRFRRRVARVDPGDYLLAT